jgi:hypothetical protein
VQSLKEVVLLLLLLLLLLLFSSVPYLEQINSILSYCMLFHRPSSSKTSYCYFFGGMRIIHPYYMGMKRSTSSYNLYLQQITIT